jgi:predicted DNA-binding protein (MmcQ/YjbR family)
MALEIDQAVREICLWLPEAEEFLSHGSPNFRVRGKTFATYVVNHHGDGRVALWLNSPAGSQDTHVRADPQHFFIPPYVGPRGWLGVTLDGKLAWQRIAGLVREAYEKVAPSRLQAMIGATPAVKTPKPPSATDVDPFKARKAIAALKGLAKICAAYPETSPGRQFGNPSWLVGKKTFAIARHDESRLTLCFWVGVDQQGILIEDGRYRIPAYFGHRGWISLDVRGVIDWQEVTSLAEHSYRHFALKRMLQQLDG